MKRKVHGDEYTNSTIKNILFNTLNAGFITFRYEETDFNDSSINPTIEKEFLYPHLKIIERDLAMLLFQRRAVRSEKRLKKIGEKTYTQLRGPKPLQKLMVCPYCQGRMLYKEDRLSRQVARCQTYRCHGRFPARPAEKIVFTLFNRLGLSVSGERLKLLEPIERRTDVKIDSLKIELEEARAKVLSLAEGSKERNRLTMALADGIVTSADYKAAIKTLDINLARASEREASLKEQLDFLVKSKQRLDSISERSKAAKLKAHKVAQDLMAEAYGPIPDEIEREKLAFYYIDRIELRPMPKISPLSLSGHEAKVLFKRGVLDHEPWHSKEEKAFVRDLKKNFFAIKHEIQKVNFELSIFLISSKEEVRVDLSNPSVFIDGLDDPKDFSTVEEHEKDVLKGRGKL